MPEIKTRRIQYPSAFFVERSGSRESETYDALRGYPALIYHVVNGVDQRVKLITGTEPGEMQSALRGNLSADIDYSGGASIAVQIRSHGEAAPFPHSQI